MKVSDDQAIKMARGQVKEAGIFAGLSSGVNVATAELLKTSFKEKQPSF